MDIVAQGAGAQMPNMGAGTVSTTVARGGEGTAGTGVLLETSLVQARINPVVQFNIDNTGAGNANQVLRIGSESGQPDSYLQFGLPASAADDAVITDDYGVGCLKVQGFSRLVSSKAVAITELKVIEATPSDQLQQAFVYKSLQYDGTIDEIKQNIAFTQEKVDQRDNLVRQRGLWVLDAQQLLEYTVLAGKKVSLFVKISAADSAKVFKSTGA
jgi:hypothetical protein